MSGRIVDPASIGAALRTIGITYNAKLRANRQLIALSLGQSPEKLLVRATSIHAGRVIISDPQFQRRPPRPYRTLVASRPTEFRHPTPDLPHDGTANNHAANI